ncbi:MAG: cobalamin-dependent protein [Planctomycetales bacterium]|nr:cobalamin-dependent protein [Planctomycetales bacterium]
MSATQLSDTAVQHQLEACPRHPRGSQARVLLASVFGPYAQDDAFGSRIINPMELYHNQVTRVQHAFSLRTFNRSWGLMLIQVNIQAPCTLLDFPTEERFLAEITQNEYDVIGISSIQTNLFKVRRMCKMIRKHQPQAEILVGGHIANFPELKRYCDCDHVVQADGVRWVREYLGEDPHQPIRHPQVVGNVGSRIMGTMLHRHAGDHCATLIPSVGCPMGCNFCSTSAMFGGKGKSIQFYQSGRELFQVMCQLEQNLDVQAFFVMDENFLFNKQRALELLELMEEHDKAWALYLFGSANVLQQYTLDQLVRLGVSWVWMGLEGKNSQYKKLAGTDTLEFVKTLRDHGIRVLGSTIIGLEEHTPENIDEAIEHAVKHQTEFHQFMLYTPIPGTPLFRQLEAEGRLLKLSDYSIADIHGQLQFNYQHPHIPPGMENEFLLRAFRTDFEANGPSVVRIVRTTLRAWKQFKDHANPRVRRRFAYEAKNLEDRYAGVLWASLQRYRDQPVHANRISELLEELYAEMGDRARRAAPIVGRRLYRNLLAEEARLKDGWTYEPPTSYEVNFEPPPESSATPAAAVCPGCAFDS